jgi:hypothetical protein
LRGESEFKAAKGDPLTVAKHISLGNYGGAIEDEAFRHLIDNASSIEEIAAINSFAAFAANELARKNHVISRYQWTLSIYAFVLTFVSALGITLPDIVAAVSRLVSTGAQFMHLHS